MQIRLLITITILTLTSPALGGELSLGLAASQPPVDTDLADHGNGDRWLINDGSFENGECDAGSDWTCTSNTTCLPILDPLPVWGYSAYDGTLCTWLGGFCEGEPTSNSVCQDVWFEGYCGGSFHTFQWMGYVTNDGGNFVYVTVDGDVVFEKEMMLSDHTYGIWSELWFESWDYHGTHTLCFEFVATTGANMLVDFITTAWSPTAAQEISFSSIKTLY